MRHWVFNGTSTRDFPWLLVESAGGPLLPPVEVNAPEVPGRAGSHYISRKVGERVETTVIHIKAANWEQAEERRKIIAAWLDTDEPKEFYYEDTPHIRYQAILSGSTDGEYAHHTLPVTLTFTIPDPYGESPEERSKLVTSPPVTFERQSTAYNPDGTAVLPNEPRYQAGKFGEAIFIEEGTTNLLSSPENPQQEVVSVTPGQSYTLSHDMGGTEVAHFREEDLAAGEMQNVVYRDGALELARHGEDVSESADLSQGTHDQTQYDPEEGRIKLGLAFSGPTYFGHDEEMAGWAGGTNEGVKVDPLENAIVMDNFPDWEETDNMKDYLATGWDPRLTPSRVAQTANTVRMDSYFDEAVALVKEIPGRDDIRTVEFFYVLTNPPGDNYDPTAPIRTQFIFVLDIPWPGDSSRWVAFYPTLYQETDIDGGFPGYAWVRLVVTRLPSAGDNGNIDVYINGQYNRSLPAAGSTLSPRFQFIMDSSMQGRIYIADFKYTTTQLHDTQSSYQFPLIGRRYTPILDLSELGTYVDSEVGVRWEDDSDLPAGAEPYQHKVLFEANVYNPVHGWSGWQPVEDGGSIPQLEPGQSLGGTEVQLRATLQSYDYYRSPALYELILDVYGHKEEYYSSGTWTAPPIPLSDVGRASRGILNYSVMTPLNTSITAEAALEVGGVLGDWVEVGNGEAIPQLTKDQDLSDAALHLRFHFEGSPSVTPRLEEVSVEVYSAYHDEGYRLSTETDLSSIGTAVGSVIDWTETKPEGTDVVVEARTAVTGSLVDDMIQDADGNGVVDGWFVNTTTNTVYSIDQAEQAQKIHYTAVASSTSFREVWIDIPVTVGNLYSFSVDAKTDGSGVQAQAALRWLDANNTILSSTPAVVTTSTIFNRLKVDGVSPPEGAVKVRVLCQLMVNEGQTGAAWFKNVYFHEGATAEDYPTWQPCTNGGEIPGIQGTDLTGKSLQVRSTLATTDEDKTPALSSLAWRITQQEPSAIVPATDRLLLTPHGVQRWQLEQKPYATSFHPDERKRETLYFPVSVAINETEGTVSLWAYESGLKTLRYLFDTEGEEDRFALWHAENGNYYLRMNGENVAVVPAEKIGWRWFAVRWKGDEAAFFIDGEKKWEGVLSAPFSCTSDWFYIGSSRSSGAQWNERIDDLHFSNIARSDEYLTDPARLQQPAPIDDDTTYLVQFDQSLSDESAVLFYEGTAPTIPRFEVSVEKNLQHLKILHIQTGKFLLLQSNNGEPLLRPGDTVELGRPENPVLINGHNRKQFLSLDSDFFRLVRGRNTFEVTEGAQAVAYWRERWK